MQRSQDTMRRIRKLIEEIDVQIVISRELSEETRNLRQANAELRELLRKTCSCWNKHED